MTKINIHYYPYYPSSAAAIIAAVCFSLTTIVHTLQVGLKRSWALIPFTVGGYREYKTAVPFVCMEVP